jgi:hypothetical protein
MDLKNLDNIKVDEKKIESMKKDIYGKKKRSFKPAYVAAVFALVFSLGFAFPSYTKDLPIYSDIFEFFGMDNYQNAGELVNATDTDNGIKITIVDAVYSNDTISFSYVVESDKDLGEEISLYSDMHFKNNKYYSTSGSSSFKKKGDGVYIGYEDIDVDFKKPNVSPLKLTLKISEITSFYGEDYTKTKNYGGNWKFNLNLNQIKGDVYKFDQFIEKDDLVAVLDSVAVDDAGTEVKINFMNNLGLDVMAYDQAGGRLVDEDGNDYDIDERGGHGDKDIYITKYRIDEKLEKNKNYTLFIDLIKNDGRCFSAPADGSEPAKEITEDYVYTEAYKKAPKTLEFEISIRIND